MKFECHDPKLGEKIARSLLEIKAIKLNPGKPFTWASGWKSPIYCDNRLSLSYPNVRTLVKESLKKAVSKHYKGVEAIAGVATAGIPQGALLADSMSLPFLYVRSKSKSHGLSNQIEGELVPGQKVVVVEDLVSTGGSSLAAVDTLKNSGADILGMVSIFTYGFSVAKENFANAKVDLIYLSEYSLLIDMALAEGTIDPQTKETLDRWRRNPSNWDQ